MEGFGERLRARARDLGLTDAEVARRVGLSENRYGNYVRNAREPDLATLVRISLALATTPNRLLGLESEDRDLLAVPRRLERLMAAAEGLDDAALALGTDLVRTVRDHL